MLRFQDCCVSALMGNRPRLLGRAVSQKKSNTEFEIMWKILSFLRSNFKILRFIRSNFMPPCLYNFKILGFKRRHFFSLYRELRKKEYNTELEVYWQTSASSVEYNLRIKWQFPPQSSKYWVFAQKVVNTERILSIFSKFRYYGKNPVIRSLAFFGDRGDRRSETARDLGDRF